MMKCIYELSVLWIGFLMFYSFEVVLKVLGLLKDSFIKPCDGAKGQNLHTHEESVFSVTLNKLQSILKSITYYSYFVKDEASLYMHMHIHIHCLAPKKVAVWI